MKKRTIQIALYIMLCVVFLLAMAGTVMADEPELDSNPTNAVDINTQGELLAVLNDTGTKTGTYRLQSDLTIDTSTLRQEADSEYCFKGSLDGNGKTITVTAAEGGSAPLFDTLRGPLYNLNLVFEGDVVGAPVAYDIGYENESDQIALRDISVSIEGNVLYGSHNYLNYYAEILTDPYNYGNWYIHYGGEAKNLATGFAWYVWGASMENLQVNVQGNIGTTPPMNGDTTAAGFAYFAAKGENENEVRFQTITVDVAGNIQSYTDDGHASAYGFAVGTTDGTAGFGCNTIDELSHTTVKAANILADSQQGASSAIGFARFLQGYTHHCAVQVTGAIKASNQEGDAEENVYAYMNGEAYAYGFMLNTGGWSIEDRRDFVENTVTVGEISALTNSETYAGAAFAGGFAHQMMNTASSVPNLSYHDNRVKVNGSVSAEANGGGSVAAGFVTSTGRDYYDRPDHIYGNTVEVVGDICAVSENADATAAGYAYQSKTHRRNCTVQVDGDIIAQSPVQSIAAGFVGLQQIDTYYFVRNCQITVGGDIKALKSGDEGLGVAGGVVGVVIGTTSNCSVPVDISGNTVTAGGTVTSDHKNAYAGLVLGLNEHKDAAKAKITLKDNTFIGKETLIEVPGDETLYTGFVGEIVADTMEQSGNTVHFTKANGRQYTAAVEPVPDSATPAYVYLWKLTDIVEVIESHTIIATTNKGGSITPSGEVTVEDGEDQTFTIAPDFGYYVKDVLVDGKSVGRVDSYTFENVAENHTIEVKFARVTVPIIPEIPEDTPDLLELDDHDAYIQGYPDGRIKPQNNITRAEVATIFYRLLTDDARAYYKSTDSGFSDVKPGDWYNTAVSTMVQAGILTGYGDGTFKPNSNITRGEFATIAARFLSNPYSTKDRFYDTEGHWAEVYINRAAEEGWINGYSDGTFKPGRAITRAEAVTLVNNVLGRKPHADHMLPEMVTWPDNPKSAWYYEAIQEATNSHDYRWSSSKSYEIWTELLENRD